MKHSVFSLLAIVFIFSSTSCSITTNSMKEPNYHIEFYKSDFDYSPQVTGNATSIRLFGVDWKRLFKWESGTTNSDISRTSSGNLSIGAIAEAEAIPGVISISKTISSIPIIGLSSKGVTESYALYELMKNNPGYDVIIYPQYEVVKKGIPFLYRKIDVKVTARLGKIN